MATNLKLPGLPKLVEGTSATKESSGSYFQDPKLVQALANLTGNVASEAGGNYMDFVSNPTSHPLYTGALGGLLESLVPSENAARQNLGDMFRAAGNTASSTFGQKAMGLESELLRNRQGLASNLLTTLFPQVTDALFKPMSQIPSLIDATKLQKAEKIGGSVTGKAGSVGGSGAGGISGVTYTPGAPSQAPTVQIQKTGSFLPVGWKY